MSNFNDLMENKEMKELIPQVVMDSFNDLIEGLSEEDQQKLQEYSDLLKDKKLKRSLEQEISESVMPIFEKNAVLYGSFLYETAPIQESCCEDSKDKLGQLRELLGADFIAEAAGGSKMKKAGKLAAGLGAAGALGAGAYKLAQGDDVDTPESTDVSPQAQGADNVAKGVQKAQGGTPQTAAGPAEKAKGVLNKAKYKLTGPADKGETGR